MILSDALEAKDVLLSEEQAYNLTGKLWQYFGGVSMYFQVPLASNVGGYCVSQNDGKSFALYFDTAGVTLEQLAHELAHTLEPYEDEVTHGMEFKMLQVLVEELLREALCDL